MAKVDATIVRLAEVTPISWAGGETGRFLLRAEDTEGRFSYYVVVVPAGEGTVLHLHEQMDETFHVVDGEFEITVGSRTHSATAGTVVFGPREVTHAFRNVGPGPGTLHCIATPGGIEHFFEELSDALRESPPAGWARLNQLAEQHGILAVAPTSVSNG